MNCIFILGVRNLHQEYPENAHRSLKKVPEHWCYEDLCPRFGIRMSELLRGLKSSGKARTCKVVPKKVKAGFIEPMLLLPTASLPADLG